MHHGIEESESLGFIRITLGMRGLRGGRTARLKISRGGARTAGLADHALVHIPNHRCKKKRTACQPAAAKDVSTQIDLEGQEPAEVAAALGITKNNLTVRLHRARRHLRELLSRNCRACSKHGCLDCTCGESDGDSRRR